MNHYNIYSTVIQVTGLDQIAKTKMHSFTELSTQDPDLHLRFVALSPSFNFKYQNLTTGRSPESKSR